MLPWFLVLSRTYAPYVVLPFAGVIGFIGYNFENYFRKPPPPHMKSIEDQRIERLTDELLRSTDTTLAPLSEKKFVPKSVFETNVSPSLVEK